MTGISPSGRLAEDALALAHAHAALAAYAHDQLRVVDALSLPGALPADVTAGNLHSALCWSQIALVGLNIASAASDASAVAAALRARPSWIDDASTAEGQMTSAYRNWRRHVVMRIVGFAKSGDQDRSGFEQLEHDVTVLLAVHRAGARWLSGYLGDALEYPPDNVPHLELVPRSVLEGLDRLRGRYNDFTDYVDGELSRETVIARRSMPPASGAIDQCLSRVADVEFALTLALSDWRSQIDWRSALG